MKKRFLCLALCLLMLLPVALTGCGETASDDTTEGDAAAATTSAKAMTLTLYTITDKSTTEEALAAVEAKLNEITEAEYNTHLILRATTADKYEKYVGSIADDIDEQLALEAAAAAEKKAAEKAAKAAAKAAGQTVTTAAETEPETTEGEETIINEFGIEKTVYPDENGTQLDIILIDSFEMYQDFIAANRLSALDEELSIGSKAMKQYIHPNFLTAAKSGNKTYAIPNNHVVGEYEYLLVNKEIFDALYYDFDKITGFNSLEDYFKDVLRYYPDVKCLAGNYDGGVYYLDGNKSLLGAIVPTDATKNATAVPKNLLGDSAYMTYFNLMTSFEKANSIVENGTIGDGNTYAAAVVTGDCYAVDEYKDDYYVLTLKYPTATNENTFNGMYAITSYTKDVSRAMQIVSCLSTNREFINLLTYGIQDVNYSLNKSTNTITKIGKDYSMNIAYTGNQFLMYASDDMDEVTAKYAANNWELAKLQNLDMVLHPYIGFAIKYTTEDKELGTIDILLGEEGKDQVKIKNAMKYLADICDEKLQSVKDFEAYSEIVIKLVTKRSKKKGTYKEEVPTEVWHYLDDFIADLTKEVSLLPEMQLLTDAADTNSLAGQFAAFAK